MRLHRNIHKNNDTKAWINKSITLWLYPAGDKDAIAQLSTQVVFGRLIPEFSARFHVGSKGSETPWDGHLTILGNGIYWGWSRGRRLAHLITSSRASKKAGKPKYLSRELKVRVYNGDLWWNLWTNDEHRRKRRKGKYRRWAHLDGSVSLNPIEWFLGPLRYFYKDLDRHVGGTVNFEEAGYPVILTLQEVTQGRVKSKKRKFLHYTVDVDAPRGIPTHYDHSGGYKGDRTYGFSVSIPNIIAKAGLRTGEWHRDAINLVEAWVLKRRGESGFREAQEVER